MDIRNKVSISALIGDCLKLTFTFDRRKILQTTPLSYSYPTLMRCHNPSIFGIYFLKIEGKFNDAYKHAIFYIEGWKWDRSAVCNITLETMLVKALGTLKCKCYLELGAKHIMHTSHWKCTFFIYMKYS